MIFVTVGSQLPFDRLIRAVDKWCVSSPGSEVFGQIGGDAKTAYFPKNFDWTHHMSPDECDELTAKAELVVAHAGMGSIINALSHSKPILVLPRKAELFEHRNDHQIATVKKFSNHTNIHVAHDEHLLVDMLDKREWAKTEPTKLNSFGDESLITKLETFIFDLE